MWRTAAHLPTDYKMYMYNEHAPQGQASCMLFAAHLYTQLLPSQCQAPTNCMPRLQQVSLWKLERHDDDNGDGRGFEEAR